MFNEELSQVMPAEEVMPAETDCDFRIESIQNSSNEQDGKEDCIQRFTKLKFITNTKYNIIQNKKYQNIKYMKKIM